MADSENILSQEEIDAMLAGDGAAPPSVAEAPPAPEAPPPEAPLAEAPPAVAPPPVVQTVQSFPASPAPSAPPSGFVPGGADSGPSQQQVQELAAQLQELVAKVDGIIAGLQATVGFNAQGTFSCKSCSSQGLVAARLTCTSCGTEDWWGWFPPQQ